MLRTVRDKCQGFTLIELLAIVVLLGMLSVVFMARIDNSAIASVQASRDTLVAALSFSQQAAMARSSQSHTVAINLSENTLSVTENGTPVPAYTHALPAGVVITEGTGIYTFDKLGRTTPGTITLTKGDVSARITLAASGYAHW